MTHERIVKICLVLWRKKPNMLRILKTSSKKALKGEEISDTDTCQNIRNDCDQPANFGQKWLDHGTNKLAEFNLIWLKFRLKATDLVDFC